MPKMVQSIFRPLYKQEFSLMTHILTHNKIDKKIILGNWEFNLHHNPVLINATANTYSSRSKMQKTVELQCTQIVYDLFCSRIFQKFLFSLYSLPPLSSSLQSITLWVICSDIFQYFALGPFDSTIYLMSNQIAQENQAGKSDSTESSYNRSKNFEVPLGYVEYRNIQERVEYDQDNDEGLRIKNYLCHQSQNKFIKVTEIRWKNQTLKITDEYCINQKFSKRGQTENQSKVFHSKRFNYSQPNNSEKKDTKNLIKNIINLFSKWLRIAKPPQFEVLAEQLKQIIDKNIYYNKILINEISEQRDISEAFIVFCANDGEDMVQHSRINDKKCHIKAIKNYQKYFEEKVKAMKEPEGQGILAKVESF